MDNYYNRTFFIKIREILFCVSIIILGIISFGCNLDFSKINHNIIFLNQGKVSSESISLDNGKFGGTFRRGISDYFLTLDPADVTDSYSHEIVRLLFDTLFIFDETCNLVPLLVKNWTISEDKTTYILRLKENIFFHDRIGFDNIETQNKGRKLIADDVIYTFHRFLSPAQKKFKGNIYNVIEGVEEYKNEIATYIKGISKLDNYTVVFKLKKPFAPFLSLLSICNSSIVPKEDAEYYKDKFASNPVGTGPFKWLGIKNGNIKLLANKNYFRGKPKLDFYEYVIIKNENERFKKFLDGELELVDVPDPEYKNVKQNAKLSSQLLEVSRWGLNYLGFNITKYPFDNLFVRQAINYAIDREAIVKLILNERARVAKGILPPGIAGFSAKSKGYDYDPLKAKELLAKAGYKDGKGFPEIELQFNNEPTHIRAAELILANLKDIGITCKMKIVDFREHLKAIEEGKASFFRLGWTVDYPDPDDFLYTNFHSSNINNGYNFSHYSNIEVDKLLEQARFELNQNIRNELYQKAEQIILNDAPWVPVFYYTTHILVQDYVKNIKLTPLGIPYIQFYKVWLKKQP